MLVDAVLPAGGRIEGQFAREAGADVKALIALGGRSLLERAIDAVRATGRVRRVAVVGPDVLQAHPSARRADAVLAEGASGPENVYRGLDWLAAQTDGRPPDRVLVLTTDLPFLTPDALNGFIDACPRSAAISLPVIERREFEARFPASDSQFVRLADGQWTIGSAFLVDPRSLAASRAHIDRVFRARKSQLGMARMLGVRFVVRYLTRQLAVQHIEARCAGLLGCSGAAVRGCAPELAFDIDQPEDYRYTISHLPREIMP